ncbi:50S ribosomal protein L30 [Oribacterium sp. HCP28S3_H8]|jgi:large subunit ribosomal protein L30|uniref:50S ribosomal protein L30 n=1 Tax=Oribacterium sp. HCP28S3_H8 TaxID=3438945 RepID=UPI0030710ADC|nr:50S ribosomal protein L30 [Oribacterium sp.]
MADKLKITLVKSPIAAIPKQRATIEALGLRKIRQSVELPNNNTTKGMIQRVNHLVKVEEI